MTYETEVPYRGDPQKAARTARELLAQNSFRITPLDARSFEAAGPGMNSTEQNPLRGASLLTFQATSSHLTVQADLGGVRSIGRFLVILISSLGLLFFILFSYLFGLKRGLLSLIPLSPWPFLGPLLVHMQKKRTQKAIDTFLHNVTAMD